MNSNILRIKKFLYTIYKTALWGKFIWLYFKYKEFTMISVKEYGLNLSLCHKYKKVLGSVVECGVWRGGMSAGMAEILGKDRAYYLCDSFEGLPPAQEIDGKSAIEWQNNKDAPGYLENCAAEQTYAEQCMSMSGAKNVHFIRGWFNESLPNASIDGPIAILRLDADWYSSTMDCLINLFDKVASGGIIILDDYHVWDGCSRATHDFLSDIKSDVRIFQYQDSLIHYLVKK